MKWRYLPIFAVVFLVSCALTDQQIMEIADTVEKATHSVIETGIEVAAPPVPGVDWGGSGAAGGIAAVIAAGVAMLTRTILKAVQKKPRKPSK